MDLYQIFITHNRSWSVRGDYNIFSVAVFNSWFIIEAVEIWKIRKNTVFCSDRIICFRKHRFWIYCIYTDIRKKNV